MTSVLTLHKRYITLTPTYSALENLLTARTFQGDPHEVVNDGLSQVEHDSAFNHWDGDKKLRRGYFSLKDGARTWFQNTGVLMSWFEFQCRHLQYCRSCYRRERAERELQSGAQMQNEVVTLYVEDMTPLFKRADPTLPE